MRLDSVTGTADRTRALSAAAGSFRFDRADVPSQIQRETAMSILVVGATGNVGGQIVRGLQQRKQHVRALVRGGQSHPKAGSLRDSTTEIVAGDLTRAETLDSVCQGIEAVITTATSMPTGANDGLRRVDHDGTLALIAAAERAHVKKFIYVSYSGNVREESPLE